MAKPNGQDLPFHVAGGGIGGLVAAYALASKGFPVRVIEQSPDGVTWTTAAQVAPTLSTATFPLGSGARVRVKPVMNGVAGGEPKQAGELLPTT